MSLRILTAITLLAFIIQIAYSINYSIKIVDENYLINQLQNNLSQIEIDNQTLKNQLAVLNSLEGINTHSTQQLFVPINSIIDLNK